MELLLGIVLMFLLQMVMELGPGVQLVVLELEH
jgi:hypothetical protein